MKADNGARQVKPLSLFTTSSILDAGETPPARPRTLPWDTSASSKESDTAAIFIQAQELADCAEALATQPATVAKQDSSIAQVVRDSGCVALKYVAINGREFVASAVGRFGASAALYGLKSLLGPTHPALVIGLPIVTICLAGVAWTHIESVKKPAYAKNPSVAFDRLQNVALASAVVVPLTAVTLGAVTLGTLDIGVDVAHLFAVNAAGRLFRQMLLSSTQFSVFTGYDLVHLDGSELSAVEQRTVNTWRDLLCTGFAMTVSLTAKKYAQEISSGVFAIPEEFLPEITRAAMTAMAGALHDMLIDGVTPDLAKFVASLWLEKLQGTETQFKPAKPPAEVASMSHFLDNASSRVVFGLVNDMLSAPAVVAKALDKPLEYVTNLTWPAFLLQGVQGGLRSRGMAAVTSETGSSGKRDVDGLISQFAYVLGKTPDALNNSADAQQIDRLGFKN